jgi:hypothetical protein
MKRRHTFGERPTHDGPVFDRDWGAKTAKYAIDLTLCGILSRGLRDREKKECDGQE